MKTITITYDPEYRNRLINELNLSTNRYEVYERYRNLVLYDNAILNAGLRQRDN